MKKLLCILVVTNFLSFTSLLAQPTDKPLHNFYVDKEDITIKYQQVFDTGAIPAKTLEKFIKAHLLKLDNIEKLELDTSTNILTGHLKNIVPKYYKSSSSKELVADFTIEVKDGKYRVFIHDMYWQNNSTTPMGFYGYTSNTKERLEATTINKKGTEWKPFAYSILPDLDDVFSKKFSIAGSSSDF